MIKVGVPIWKVGSMSELASGPNLQRDFPGKDRKKAKVKKIVTVAKPRTIKFHEYKVLYAIIFLGRYLSVGRYLGTYLPTFPRYGKMR